MMTQALLGAGGEGPLVAAGVSSVAVQSVVGNSTPVVLTFDTLDPNSDPGIWNSATRFTAPTAGFYFISGFVQWQNEVIAQSVRSERIRINGVNIYNLHSQVFLPETSNRHCSSAVYFLNEGDYVELVVSWNFVTGATTAVTDARFAICKLRAGTIAQRPAAQAIAVSTRTPITFSGVVAGQDTGGFWSAGAPTVLTADRAGMYVAFCSVAWDYVDNSGRRAYITNMGIPSRGYHAIDMLSAVVVNHCAAVLYMAAADSVNLYVEQGTLSPLNANGIYLGLSKGGAASLIGGSCRRAGGAQSIPSGGGTGAPIAFDVCDGNQGGIWTVGAPTRVTVPAGEAGWYALSGFVQWAAGPISVRQAQLRKNGTDFLAYGSGYTNTSSPYVGQQVAACVYLAAGDYVELLAAQTSGTTLGTTLIATDAPVLAMAKLK